MLDHEYFPTLEEILRPNLHENTSTEEPASLECAHQGTSLPLLENSNSSNELAQSSLADGVGDSQGKPINFASP